MALKIGIWKQKNRKERKIFFLANKEGEEHSGRGSEEFWSFFNLETLTEKHGKVAERLSHTLKVLKDSMCVSFQTYKNLRIVNSIPFISIQLLLISYIMACIFNFNL